MFVVRMLATSVKKMSSILAIVTLLIYCSRGLQTLDSGIERTSGAKCKVSGAG